MLRAKMTIMMMGMMSRVIEASAYRPSIMMSLMKRARKSPNCDVPFQIGSDVLLFLSKYCDNN